MRVQHFQRRNLRLQGSWVWLLGEFAPCYGVSESYTKLRYERVYLEWMPTHDVNHIFRKHSHQHLLMYMLVYVERFFKEW